MGFTERFDAGSVELGPDQCYRAVASRDDQQALLQRSLEALTRGFRASGA